MAHESARACPLERVRHHNFLRQNLLIPLGASIAAPLLLAFSGAPAPWQAAAFGVAMLPLAGVALVSRRGDLREGEALAAATLAGVGGVAAIAAGPGLGAGLFLLLAPLEAAFRGPTRRWLCAASGSALMGLLLAAASISGASPAAGSAPLVDSLFALCATVYGLLVAYGWRLEQGARDALLAQEREAHAGLRGLVGDAVVRFNRAGAVLSAGAGCQAAIGLRAREVAGRGFFERVQVADRPMFLKALSDAARPQGAATIRLRLRGADVESRHGAFAEPAFRHVEICARWQSGVGDGAVVTALLRDVTDLIEAEALLVARKAATMGDVDWKDRLLANVSHELRTPLNAIIGFSELLGGRCDNAPDEAQRREYADIINAAGQHLLSVVNAILDMSTIEAGRYVIAPEPLDLAPVVDSCCDIVRLKAQEAGVEIRRALDADALRVVADRRACRQILLNLLSNAIKFTPQGGRITVAARRDGDHLAISVADTGVGVRPQDLPRLGEAFFQACDEKSNEGTGLGLSVVKGLVGLHGGAMLIESAPGQGACVTVRLPRDAGTAPKATGEGARIEVIPRRPAAPLNDDALRCDAVRNAATMVKKIA